MKKTLMTPATILAVALLASVAVIIFGAPDARARMIDADVCSARAGCYGWCDSAFHQCVRGCGDDIECWSGCGNRRASCYWDCRFSFSGEPLPEPIITTDGTCSG